MKTARSVLDRLIRRSILTERVAIVGASDAACRFLEAVASKAGAIDVVGVFDDRSFQRRRLRFGQEGTIAELIRLAHRSQLDHIIVTLPAQAESRFAEVLHRLKQVPVRVSLAPDQTACRLPPQAVTRVAGIPMINLAEPPLTRSQKVVKEALDRTLSLLLLLLLSPCFLVIAGLIRLDGPGPVFFSQERYGLGNRTIRVYKFRTMRAELSDPECRQQTSRDDPRITRIGHFLRRTSLDELPQLWNVLVGDMSLVGPRPHAVGMRVAGRPTNDVDPLHLIRHRVKPGITGLAQVNGCRGGIDDPAQLKERVRYDLKYMEEWSIWLDIAILIWTAVVVVSRKNAY